MQTECGSWRRLLTASFANKTRPSRTQAARRRGGRGVAQTLADPPVEATHWTSAMMMRRPRVGTPAQAAVAIYFEVGIKLRVDRQ
jgi:hypothetical protein